MTERMLNTPGENEPQWEEILCYFGSGCWPESVTYRVAGDRVQALREGLDDEGTYDWVEVTTAEGLEIYSQDVTYAGPTSR